MSKFKIGQILTVKPYYQGFEKITIYDIDSKFYYCKIMNGKVTIPIHTAENNYQVLKEYGKEDYNRD